MTCSGATRSTRHRRATSRPRCGRPDGHIAVIGEIKRRSPSKGDLAPDLDPAVTAKAYESGGAAALSVLTDAPFFGGRVDDLTSARDATTLPVLRKDFTIDEVQVYESRAIGADAILLIVAARPDDELLADLHAIARELGLAVLVEAHDAFEIERALRAGAEIVGVNNRDLATFKEDLGVGEGLAARIPGVGDRRRRVGGAHAGRRRPARCRRVRCGARRRGAGARRRPCRLGARPRGRARESEVVMDTRFVLPQDQIPTAWYNALPDLPEPMQPPLHPGTKEPVGPDDLAPLFPMALIEQEMTGAPTIDIPGPVLDILRLWRPTPLVRARRLEAALGTPARIYYKDESVSPAGSHKPNTAVAQAYYNKESGTAAARDRDRRRTMGFGARVRVRAVRSRVQGLHGARVVRAEAVPAGADGDVGRVGRAVTGRRPDASRARSARRSATRCATPGPAPTRTTRSARCSTTCCCTRRSSGSRPRSSSRSPARPGPTS